MPTTGFWHSFLNCCWGLRMTSVKQRSALLTTQEAGIDRCLTVSIRSCEITEPHRDSDLWMPISHRRQILRISRESEEDNQEASIPPVPLFIGLSVWICLASNCFHSGVNLLPFILSSEEGENIWSQCFMSLKTLLKV